MASPTPSSSITSALYRITWRNTFERTRSRGESRDVMETGRCCADRARSVGGQLGLLHLRQPPIRVVTEKSVLVGTVDVAAEPGYASLRSCPSSSHSC